MSNRKIFVWNICWWKRCWKRRRILFGQRSGTVLCLRTIRPKIPFVPGKTCRPRPRSGFFHPRLKGTGRNPCNRATTISSKPSVCCQFKIYIWLSLEFVSYYFYIYIKHEENRSKVSKWFYTPCSRNWSTIRSLYWSW